MPLWNISKQKVHSDTKLSHMLFEPCSRVLWSLPSTLQQVLVSLGVVQLHSLDTTQVVIIPTIAGYYRRYFLIIIKDSRITGIELLSQYNVPGPLIVAGLLWECAFQHQLVCLVVEVVVQVVPEQAIDQDSLALEVIP